MKLKKIIILVTAMLIFGINVYADSSIDVNKRLNGVDNPNALFTYEIVSSDTNPDNTNFNPNTFTISFDENSVIEDRLSYGSYTLDFGSINYSIPGKYEYVVRETSSSDESIYPKDNNYYTIEVNVKNIVDDNNHPTGDLIVDVMQSAFVNDTSGKGEILFETSPLTYISLNKTVTGDMGDINEYFKFKIEIDGDGYVINGQDSSVVYNGEVINTINTYDSSKDNFVYLKHGQSITIGLDDNTYQIPSNVLYSIEEYDASNYKTYINNGTTNRKSIVTYAINTPQTNNVSYENNYESSVLTGIFLNTIPFVGLIGLSTIGIYVLKKKSKKTNNN